MRNHCQNSGLKEKAFFLVNALFFFCAFFLCVTQIIAASEVAPLQQRLFDDMLDQRLDDFSHTEAAFILSNVRTEDSLTYYVDWYQNLVGRIRDFRFDDYDRVKSAEKLFNYIRTTLYDEYELEATTLVDIVERRKYNCVSSTILYNLVCEDLGWSTQAFETPTHVYTIFTDLGKRVMVENTHPMGFNIMGNLREYSRYLAQFYPEGQVAHIGLDQLYAYEHANGRIIDNTELLGLLAYNQAYFAMKREDYAMAYQLVLAAQDFNADSRSNVNLETNLYYKWGKLCFDDGRYFDAFQVFADGYYRYPDNKDFAQNTLAAFSAAMDASWRSKDWKVAERLTRELIELEILDEAGVDHVQKWMASWAGYFAHTGAAEQRTQAHKLQKDAGNSKRH